MASLHCASRRAESLRNWAETADVALVVSAVTTQAWSYSTVILENPYAAGGLFGQYKMMRKTETLAYGTYLRVLNVSFPMSTNMTRFIRDQTGTHISDLYGEFAPGFETG